MCEVGDVLPNVHPRPPIFYGSDAASRRLEPLLLLLPLGREKAPNPSRRHELTDASVEFRRTAAQLRKCPGEVADLRTAARTDRDKVKENALANVS